MNLLLRLSLLATLVAPLAAAAPSPTPEGSTEPGADATRLQQGKELYQYWCASCHGRGPGHPGTQALEARYRTALPGVLEDRANLTPELVEFFVRNGLSVMPFFRKTEIDDDELAAIGAYLSHNPSD